MLERIIKLEKFERSTSASTCVVVRKIVALRYL